MEMTQTPQELSKTALARATRHEVQLPSVKTTYWSYPANQVSAGTIVFIHGYRGNHHGLEAIIGALPEFNVIAPDLPGFGEAAPLAGKHSVLAYANWLTEFMDAVAQPDTTLLAHSFGTIVAAAAAQSGLANRLVLINPVSKFERRGRDKVLEQLTDGFYSFSGMLPESAGNVLLKNPVMVRVMSEVLAKTKNKQLRSWIHKQHDENFSEFAERRVAIEAYAASTSMSVSSYASSINNQTLLIAGELDDITNLADQQRVLRMFPHAELDVIRGVGHLVHYETPAAAAEFTRNFILRG
jgi:pimeloyl-ACP methyl ester carboxylesterase